MKKLLSKIVLFIILSLTAFSYNFPIDDPYSATIIGSATMIVLRYTLSNNITYVSEHLIKYNTKHLDGYFEVSGWGVVPLNDNNKKYNKMKITWSVSWNFIKGLLNR